MCAILGKASQTIKNMRWFEVIEPRGHMMMERLSTGR